MHMPIGDNLEINLLAANQHQADHNREAFDAWRLLSLNVMSSPGAGKTALLERSLPQLCRTLRMAVLEGDMTTQLDAQRLEAVGVPVVPITTGRACHLDASMVQGGLRLLQQRLDPSTLDLLWIENVGNLLNDDWGVLREQGERRERRGVAGGIGPVAAPRLLAAEAPVAPGADAVLAVRETRGDALAALALRGWHLCSKEGTAATSSTMHCCNKWAREGRML